MAERKRKDSFIYDSRKWYDMHVIEKPKRCRCRPTNPDNRCDKGEALFRLQQSHRAQGIVGYVR